MRAGSASRRDALLAAGVLLALVAGLALRLRLASADYWFNPDEGIYHQIATVPSADEARAGIRGNVHPPLHYWILRTLAPLGDDPRTLRFPSLTAGLLTILASAWLGSAAGAAEGGAAGAVAGAWFGALVVALSPGLALQSVTMRPYSLQALALTLGLGALLRFLTTGRRRWLALFSASFSLAVLLVYSSYLVVGGVGIVLLGALLAGRLSRRQVAYLALATLPVLAILAWSWAVHLRPFVIGGQLRRDAQATWLRTQFVASPAAGLAALRGAADYAWSREMRPLILLPTLLAVGLACVRRRGPAAFVALAVAGLALALSGAGLVPLGASRHSLHLVAVQVAAGATGVAWLVGLVLAPGAAGAGRPRFPWARILPAVALTALLARSAGARAVLLYRASSSGRIDSEDSERVIRRRSIETISSFVRSAPPAVWITDLQTTMLLLPLASPEGRTLHAETAFGGQRFEALGRSFAVLPLWSLQEALSGQGDPLDRALTWIAARGGLPGGPVGVVTGGWGPNAALSLTMELDAHDKGASGLEAVGDRRLAALVVEARALRAWGTRHAEGKLR